jgi:hypothetical protein
MLFAIPNPQKKFSIDFSIEKAKIGVERIPLLSTKFKLVTKNDVINQFTFEALEFLSLGVFVEINLSRMDENKTEVNIEIKRKVGSFNQAHEVTNANNHLSNLVELLSKGLTINEDEVLALQEKKREKENEGLIEVNGQMVSVNYKRNRVIIGIVFLLLILLFLAVLTRIQAMNS